MATDPSALANELKKRELDLSEARLRQDRELKELELKTNAALKEKELEQAKILRERDLEIQRNQLAAGRWTGPVAVAVVAGIIGIAGSLFSSYASRETERKKQEGTVILEAIRTNATGEDREKQVAANLVFFADAGLVTLGADQLKKLRDRAGDVSPSLPPAPGTQSAPIPDPVRQRIQKSFDKFGSYFQTLGLKQRPMVDVQTVPPDVQGALAYYEREKNTVFIDKDNLSDENLPLREYAHAVLMDDQKWKALTDVNATWVYFDLESGLASYFSSSLRNSPQIPSGASGPHDTLENPRKVTDMQPGYQNAWNGMLAWGAAFWDLRKALTSTVADKLLYQAWVNVDNAEILRNDKAGFVQHLIQTDMQLNQGTHAAEIKSVFSNRGLPLP
jgi:hypothetical protein